jgi:uncharacterized membrane protein YebE (DUF533 family)
MDLSRLLGIVVQGALGGKRKKSRKAQRWVSSGRGSPLRTAGALVTAAGVAWGLFETWQNQKKQGQGTAPAAPPGVAIDPILRLVRLTVAAARADGTLSDGERSYILDHARQAGVEDIVAREIDTPVPVAEIVRGVTDPAQKRELYALAFTIVRADEDVSHVERIWLAQLAVQLGLDASESARIETETAAALDAAPES